MHTKKQATYLLPKQDGRTQWHLSPEIANTIVAVGRVTDRIYSVVAWAMNVKPSGPASYVTAVVIAGAGGWRVRRHINGVFADMAPTYDTAAEAVKRASYEVSSRGYVDGKW